MAAANRGRGTWDTDVYEPVDIPGKGRGCQILLSFDPDDDVGCSKIGLVQVVTSSIMTGLDFDAINTAQLRQGTIVGNKAHTKASRSTGSSHVDRESSFNNPIYGAPDLDEGVDIRKTKRGDLNVGPPPNSRGTYCLGRSKTLWKSKRPPSCYDAPVFAGPHDGDQMIFETGAVCLKGDHKGTWLGSVTWGWQKTRGVISVIPLHSHNSPCRDFVESLQQWNGSKSSENRSSIVVPIP
jgi:hypothetical protein